jgi:hypothetical protein
MGQSKTITVDLAAVVAGRALTDQETALAWALAPHLGLTDSIGGGEWRERVASGDISPAVVKILREAGLSDSDE